MSGATSPAGLLLILLSPSGGGKSSLVARLLAKETGLSFSVSHTTRPPRPAEVDGRDYFFVGEKEFRDRIASGGFLEWAEVHGHLYGTSVEQVRARPASGEAVLLDIDIQGARQVRRLAPGCVIVFILPPDYETLRRRLAARGTDSSAEIASRLENAAIEVRSLDLADYVVINEDLDRAAGELEAILVAERHRAGRMRPEIERALADFPRAPRSRGPE